MPMRVLSKVRRSIWTLPMAALAALIVFAINEAAYRESVDSLDHLGSRAVARVQIQTVLRSLIEVETGQRGYLLTARTEYLKPIEETKAEIDSAMQWLARYYGEDPAAAPALQEMTARIDEKFSEVETTVKLHDEGRHEAWRELMLTNIGLDKMVAIRGLADRLHAIESRRIAADRQDVYDTLRTSRIGVNAMTALSLLALVLFLRQTSQFDAVQRQHAAALRAERDHLEAQVQHRTAELTELAGHLQTAREDEKSRLARELHDELGALLTAAKLDAARLKRSLGPITPEAEARLKHLNDTINEGIGLKRRIIEDLRPSSLSNLGLVAALEIQAREFAQRAEIAVRTELEALPLPDSAQITLFRLVQESFTNIAKYAGAREVVVELAREGERAHIRVRDDGRGFDPALTRRSAHGLVGMRYRVEAEGGQMRVNSAPGTGTVIEAWLPLQDETAAAGVAEAGEQAHG